MGKKPEAKTYYSFKEVIDKYFGGKDYTTHHVCPCCGHEWWDDEESEKKWKEAVNEKPADS